MVCIIDDREDVWKSAPNLVHVRPYRFFDGTADINAPPEASKTDDLDDDSSQQAGVGVTRPSSRRSVRVVRLPKNSRELSSAAEPGKHSAAESSSSVSAADHNGSDSHTACAGGLQPNAVVTASKSSPTEQTDAAASADLASDDPAVETYTSNSDPAVASTDSASDRCPEHHSDSDDAGKTATAVNDDRANGEPTSVSGDGPECRPVERSSSQDDDEYEELIEWEDVDDYLIYLEDILRRIHAAYYDLYDQMQRHGDASSAGTAPDLRTIVPYVRRRVLKGARIVLSGVCPLDADPSTCRIYRVAESLGAVVQPAVVSGCEATTHVVAARPGTEKVKAAARQKGAVVWTVNPAWLWTCAERWEWVDERLYPLSDETAARFLSRDSPDPTAGAGAKPREKDTSCGKVEPTSSDAADSGGLSAFSLASLSKEEICGMDAEVEKILDEESDSEFSDNDSESGGDVTRGNEQQQQLYSGVETDDAALRRQVLSNYSGGKRSYEESSDEESLSGDFPRGWKNSTATTKRRRVSADGDRLVTVRETVDDEDEVDDVKSDESRSGNSSSADEDFSDSVGSIDDEIAAAVEKEFLS